MNGTHTAVLDRIVDGTTAVLLLEDGDRAIEGLDVDVERLPDEGRHEGAVLGVTLENGSVVEIVYRREETEERRNAMQERFDRLSKRFSDADE